MEQLLAPERRHCAKCGAPFLFRQCKYGCEFGCKCSRSTFDSVLDEYVAELHTEKNQIMEIMGDFVPCVRGAKAKGTLHEPIVSVEVDFGARRALVQFWHCSSTLIHFVNESLSSAVLAEAARLDNGAFTTPLELVDLVVFELRALAQGTFFVNAPSAEVLEAAGSGVHASQAEMAAELPAMLQQHLLQHQVDGVRRILNLGGRALLCDEMGVGKTLTALGVISALKEFPVLVVCPSSVKHIWAEEIEKFLVPHLASLGDIHVIKSSNDALERGAVPKIVVVSYHMAVRLSGMIRETPWRCVVCDESHLLHTNTSGSDALYTTLMGGVAKQSPYCVLLSGTPIMAGAFDLFNQIDALHPGLLGPTRWDFALRYCSVVADPFLKIGACVRQCEFSSLVEEKIMVRRRKKEVLDLPSKQRILYPVEEDNEDDEGGGCAGEHWTASNFQQRYKSNWVLKRKGISRALDYLRATNQQIVLFAHHVELLHFLEAELKQRRESYFVIKGGVDMDVRQHLIRSFAEKRIKFAIVGITACSVGVSLASASCAVFCELPPNATLLKQAEDRLHRPGQGAKTTFYYLVGQKSRFDKVLFERLKEDDSEARRLIDGDSTPLSFCFTSRSPRRHCDAAAVEPERRAMSEAHVPCSHKLLFTISRYTGRIHVKGEDNAFYTTLTLDEARRCACERSRPMWQQLGDFLRNYDALSSYGQRQLKGSWLTSDSRVNTKNHPTGKVNRYRLHFRCGWGFWTKIKQPAFSFALFCPLLKLGEEERFTTTCLECGKEKETTNKDEAVRPGDMHEAQSDTALFCSGRCRESFYFKRSSSFMRRIIVAEDKGVCAVCGVQCEVLVSRLQQCASISEREGLLKSMHPQILDYSKLYHNLIQNPTAGVCWNADHIIPVSFGGGEATKDNIQTLCVVCHGIKTVEERKTRKRKRSANEKRLLSTVDKSLDICCVHNRGHRITKTRFL